MKNQSDELPVESAAPSRATASFSNAAALLAAIVESSEDAIISKTLDGIILSWNQGAERLYGYTAAEAIGQPISLIIPTELWPEIHSILGQIRRGERVHDLETLRQRKDGSLLDVSLKVSPVLDETGHIIGASAIAREISEAKRTRQALEQSERLYHTLASNFPNGSVFLFDLNLRSLLIEGRGLAEAGFSRERLLGQHVSDVLQGVAGKDELVKLYEAALTGRESAIEVQVGGRWRVVQIVPVRREQGEIIGVLGMSQDITAQKQSEALLRESEERFRQMAESIDEVFWMSDPATEHIFYISPAYEKVWGRTCRSLYEQPSSFIAAIHPDDREAHARALDAKGQSGELNQEYRIIRPDGTTRWIWDRAFPVYDETGALYRIAGIAQDITERKEAEANLRQSEERLRAQYKGFPVPTYTWRRVGEDFVLMDYNAAVETISQGRVSQLRGQPASITYATRPDILEDFAHCFRERTVIRRETPYRLLTTGEERHFIATYVPIQPDLLMVHTEDITERRHAEANLQQAHDALQRINDELELRVIERTAEAEKAREDAERAREDAETANRSKSEFLSRMSHELRTPLNSILGFAQLMEMHARDEKEAERVGYIMRGGQHLLKLINEVLDISRIETGNLSLSPEAVSLSQALQIAVDLIRPLCQQRELRLHFDPAQGADLYVYADQQRLAQVLINLLSNAVKYNRAGGDVRLQHSVIDGQRVRISVSDTGNGIAPKNLSRLFQPFDRLGAETTGIEGTGLGLSLTKHLIEAMGGSISVHSTPGAGSTFFVELALTENPFEEVEQEGEGKRAIDTLHKEHTLLYMEDNLANIQVIEHVMGDYPSIQLVCAMQGSIGLELAREHHPSLILLDLHLPDLQGDEVLRRLLAEPTTADIPVVIITADATPQRVRRLLLSGATDYLTKPIDIPRFVELVHQLLREREV